MATVSFGDIYSKANGSTPGSATSFATMSSLSYFEGPNGNNTISYNAWGRNGNTSAGDRIYNLTPASSDFKFGAFSSGSISPTNVKDYFYDSTEYKCNLTVYNNLPADVPFPPPGVQYNVQDVNLTLRDSTSTYSYITLSSGVVLSLGNGGGTYGPLDAATPNVSPLIFRAYWEIVIASSPNFPGATADLSINGSAKYTGTTVNGGGAPTTLNSAGSSTQDMATGYGGNTAGFDFVLTIY